ncbi:diacylglycerol kinase family enzyme [Paenarthrobacter nicotinovorans]|uniref:diacylglycerol/lipid kinase family protein n=1 Tax=Micrococcaceae TaxID=1268 RepID=UPI0008765C8F|nr:MULTISPECIES: diacylglycerol kinase family protein [Micrococcaceae]MDR6436747.1 diacylglycerol kinase family enzyme [Paenarthrobacter nicotinovorans]SCZ56732.1 Diacylglycerol kinase family enzyme [Arthrobacter sp. UNCCL28]
MTDASAPHFDRVVLIFNPDKPGMGAQIDAIEQELLAALPDMKVQAQPTAFAGHARELARSAASKGSPLIISVSGDGGYNEVVNGVMDVPSTRAVWTVLPAGNANDHFRSMPVRQLREAVRNGSVRPMDLLRITLGGESADRIQYAHSYIGFGLTPLMAIGIEKGGKGKILELLSVTRTLSSLEPFELERSDGATAEFDSFVLANISRMAKYGTVSENNNPNDGQFEVVTLPHTGRWRMALMTLRAVTLGLGRQPSVNSYSFISRNAIPCQIDGKVVHIPANTQVLVESAKHALTII